MTDIDALVSQPERLVRELIDSLASLSDFQRWCVLEWLLPRDLNQLGVRRPLEGDGQG